MFPFKRATYHCRRRRAKAGKGGAKAGKGGAKAGQGRITF